MGLAQYLGGKFRQAKWIAAHIDAVPHYCYIEPFCGMASVFYAKKPSKQTILNDKDAMVVRIFKALRDHPEEFMNFIDRIEYSYASFREAMQHTKDEDLPDWMLGVWSLYFITASFAGRSTAHSWNCATTRNQAHTWQNKQKSLPLWIEKLKPAHISQRDGVEIISFFDMTNVLFYIDPPYEAGHWYKEGVDKDALLAAIKNTKKAKIILSGYAGDYDLDWRTDTRPTTICGGGNSGTSPDYKKQTECLWFNY